MSGEEDEDSYVANRHWNLKKKEHTKEGHKWSERCIGFWHKDVNEKDSKTQQICTGINVIRVYKNINDSKMAFSRTRGIEVIIEESVAENNSHKDEDIGSDGMISYQAPKLKKPKMDDQTKNQPALIENMIENFKEKIVNVNNRIVRYQNDPSSMTELWTECQESAQRQVETGKRILTYVKPIEKLTQMDGMVRQHVKDVLNWFNGKG